VKRWAGCYDVELRGHRLSAAGRVVKWLVYPLTRSCRFDILTSGWQGTECNSIN